jgi:hypothetical protein
MKGQFMLFGSLFPKHPQKLLHVALSLVIAVALSSCTKAQLIGAKQLKSLKLFTVASISPASGPKAGGTTITIVGTGFVSGMTIKIGNISCTSVQVLSPLSASCVTGASATSATDTVTIVNGDGNADAAHTFAYLDTMRATVTRIAAGGNVLSTGVNGLATTRVTARITSISFSGVSGPTGGNISMSPVGPNQVVVRGGVVGILAQ